MLRVHWTVDWSDAHIVAGLLRSEGVAAWVFDADFVRQNWLQAIAYGGYRVVVAPEHLSEARQIVAEYLAGDVATAPDPDFCPHCAATAVEEDPLPRRAIFVVLILDCFSLPMFALAGAGLQKSIPAVVCALLFGGVWLPLMLLILLKWRYRCRACRKRWHAPPQTSWPTLAKAAAAAEQ